MEISHKIVMYGYEEYRKNYPGIANQKVPNGFKKDYITYIGAHQTP